MKNVVDPLVGRVNRTAKARLLYAEAELLSEGGHRRVRALFARPVRVARHPRFVETVAAKLVEQRCRQFTLCQDCCNKIHGHTHCHCEERSDEAISVK